MKKKIEKFLKKAHGMDKLSQHLYYVAIAIFVFSLFSKSTILKSSSLVLLFISMFRSFSSKHYKRTQENLKYTKYYNRIIARVKVFFLNIRHFKTYKYAVCKNCNQQLRIPRKKGEVTVTCPRCRNRFDIKS